VDLKGKRIMPFADEIHGQMSVCFPAAADIPNIEFVLGTANATTVVTLTSATQFKYTIDGGAEVTGQTIGANPSRIGSTNVYYSFPAATSSKRTVGDSWTVFKGGTSAVPGGGNTSTAVSARITQSAKTAKEICFQFGNMKYRTSTARTDVTVTINADPTKFDCTASNGQSATGLTIPVANAGTGAINKFAVPVANYPATGLTTYEVLTFPAGTYVTGDQYSLTTGAVDGNMVYTPSGGSTGPTVAFATTYLNGGTIYLPTDNWPKAMWNMMMIHGDGSKGVHNPTFVSKVLATSAAQQF
jgi:hypothetical protein